jgi:lipopolysaccharide export system permease protein
MGKIIHRYVFREILTPFLLGLAVFTFVLLLARLLKLIELVVNRGLPFTRILELLAYLMPPFLEVTLPMAMLLAILVAFGRLSADAEMVALRSSGVSLYQLLPPVATFVLLAALVTLALSTEGRPWGNRSLRRALWDIARTHAAAGLKPQVFNDEFPGLVIYAEQIDGRENRLGHVLISDDRDPQQRNTVFAREGWMLADSDAQTVTLRLMNGRIVSTDVASRASYQTDFESYDVNLDLRDALAGLREETSRPAELGVAALAASIAAKEVAGTPHHAELVEWHRKFAIPFACVVFGLIAVPLGVEPSRAVKSRGFAVSLVVIFCYYILLSAGQALGERGLVPAAIGLWLPNVVLGTAGVILLRRAARERPPFGTWATDLGQRLRARLPRRLVAHPGA